MKILCSKLRIGASAAIFIMLIAQLAHAQQYNTRFQFQKTFAVGVTDSLHFSFPPAFGGKWVPYDSTSGFNLTTKPLAEDNKWTGAAAIGVRLLSGNTADSCRLAVASGTKGVTTVGVDENSVRYMVGTASTFSNDVLDGQFHVYTITGTMDPAPFLTFIFTLGDLAGGSRRVEFDFRYRRDK